jgi:hypothetical protein
MKVGGSAILEAQTGRRKKMFQEAIFLNRWWNKTGTAADF